MKDMDVKRYAVAYLRISDRKQIDGESPETQRRVIQEYADRNNVEIVEWFYDEAKSGKNTDREELQKLLAFAIKHSKKIDYVIVFKLNRASRDLQSYMTTVKAVLAGKGISIRSATEPIDDSPIGRFLEGVIVLNGQLDNEIKGSTTTENMRSLAMQGYWQHGPILGYDKHTILNDVGKPRPSMKPNSTATLVKQVLERYSEGDINPMDLMRYAQQTGLKTRGYNRKDGSKVPPKKIAKHGIYNMLQRPEYAGYVHDKFTNYELIEGKHEGIISKELYWHNQKLLKSKAKVKATYTKQNQDYPLKETLLCVGCNKPLYGSAPKTGGGKSHSARYHCYRPGCDGVKKRSLGTAEAHQAWLDLLARVEPSSGFMKLYKEVLVRQAARVNERINKQVKAKRDELDAVATTRLAAIEDRLNAPDTKQKQELTDLINKLDQDKIDLSDELDKLVDKQTLQEAKIEYAVNTMQDLAKQWRDADYDLRVRFQSMVFPEGATIDMATMQFGTENISPLYRYIPNKKDLSMSEKSLLVIPWRIELQLPG